MNFIVVVSDTLRWDHLGFSGNDWIRTPNLDKFASESLIFDRAYTGSFPTIPHRTDLMTGKWVYPYRGWSPLPKEETILSETMTAAGYVTMLINDTPHLIRDGHMFDRGFLAWHWNRGQEGDRAITDDIPMEYPCKPEKIRTAERMLKLHYRYRERHWKTERDTFVARTMQDAADWIEMNHTHDQPFFLYIDTFDPHEPWDPPRHYVEMYDPGYKGEVCDHPPYDWVKSIGLTPAEVKHTAACYAGECSLVDTWFGRVLEKLEVCGIADETVVIFHSDHGHLVGDHGRIGKNKHGGGEPAWPYFEEIGHVPLLIRAPGGPKGLRNHFLAQAVDIMPTILDLANIEIPDGVLGASLKPALSGKPLPERAVSITTSNHFSEKGAVSDMASITDGVWTLHHRGNAEAWDLFNIEQDPKQQRNLAKEAREEAVRLHALYLEQIRKAGVRDEILALRSKLP